MNFPQKWHQFLRALHDGGFPEATIAGGAIRDLDNGRVIKDVDVFVNSHNPHEIGVKLEAIFGVENVHAGLPEYVAWEKLTGDLGGLYSVSFGGETYEVIGCKGKVSAQHAALRNDMGICQIAWDGEAVFKSDLYRQDIRNKTMTVDVCIDKAAMERTLRRYERLSQKYEQHAFVVPPRLLQHLPLAWPDGGFIGCGSVTGAVWMPWMPMQTRGL